MTCLQESPTKLERFNQVHEKLRGKVLSQITGKVTNFKDAEEIAQEAWLKAWTYFDTFRGDSSIDTWMYRVTQNVMCDYFTRQAKKKEIAVSCLVNGEHGPADIEILKIPDEAYEEERERSEVREEDNLKLDRVSAAMDKLPEKFKKPLREFAFYGKQYREIAEELKVPIGTVMSRIHFAKKKIKKLL